MRLPLYQVDAFAAARFAGNPAAVCPLERWLPDATMQAIAAENNLSETAFFVPRADGAFDLRWFTPAAEVDLCGHATLASAWVVLERLDPGRPGVTFHSRGGVLTVTRDGAWLSMDFPTAVGSPCPAPAGLAAALGVAPLEVLKARDYLAVLPDEATVRGLTPDIAAIGRMAEVRGLIVTAAGREVDFVSRFFAPRAGVPEDPVTGSAHCTLVPYWAARLGRTRLAALQVSPRGGELRCELRGDRVILAGRAVPYLEGLIEV